MALRRGADEPDDDDRLNSFRGPWGVTDEQAGGLGVHQLADDEQDDGVHPHVVGQDARRLCPPQVVTTVPIIQATPEIENMAGPCLEHGGGGDLAACTLQVSRSVPGGEHDHLDDQAHARAPWRRCLPWGIRTDAVPPEAQDDDGDGAQEDPGGAVGLGGTPCR